METVGEIQAAQAVVIILPKVLRTAITVAGAAVGAAVAVSAITVLELSLIHI